MRDRIRHSVLICFLLTSIFPLWAQFEMVDSLEKVLTRKDLGSEERVDVLLDISDIYLSRNPDKSFLFTRQAIVISKQINNRSLLGRSYRSLGNCYSDRGDHDSCVTFLKLALTYNVDDALTWFFLGQNEWFNGVEDKCLEFYKKGEKACYKNIDPKTLAIIYYSYADYYRYTQQDSLAQQYISMSIKILERSSMQRDLAVAYNIQAEIYRTKGEYTQALETYTKTVRIAYQILDSNRIGYCFSRMGYIYYMQNEFHLAEQFLIRGLDIAEKVKSRNLRLFCLKSLADMFSNQANVKKCTYYARLCIAAGKEMGDIPTECLAYSSLSNLYYRTGQKDSAAIYADMAYQMSKANEDPINTLNAILNKIPIEYEAGKYDLAIQLTKEGIELATYTETMEHLKDLYKYQYRSYERIGDKVHAFDALVQFKMFEDSLQNDNVTVDVQKSQLELGYQDKHLADTLVYIDNAQKAKQEILLEKQQSKFSMIIGVIVALLLSIIILIVWVTSLRRKKLNLSLAESNHDKELLLKEIHHRVKNSLQVVSSLLNLQKSQSGHKSFNELIDESQVKIGNIAIVHELLYQSSSFKRINLQQYINQLGNHIMKTLSDSNQQIKIEKEIEDIEISLDKSVPLALVVNEIVTNSVKYAFKDRKDGVIRISCHKKNGRIEVKISDNGPGFPVSQVKEQKGIGQTLIQGFIKQLKGELKYGNDNGAFFVFSFPETD